MHNGVRLVNRDSGVIGEGVHRSGWAYVLRCMEPMISENGILFDDFIEASFSFRSIKSPHQEPWVGVFHQPYDAPDFLLPHGQSIERILKSPLFRASLPYLKLGITLSSPLGTWLQKILDVPFVTLVHPTEIQETVFSEATFLANKKKRVIQIGSWLRNTSAIFQLKVPDDYTRTCLLQKTPWVKEYTKRVNSLWRYYNWGSRWNCKKMDRRSYGTVEYSELVSNDIYDHFLSENVIFIELFSAAANNTVVECIVRNTPLVVNRLPALEEYLGNDYPLFYNRIEEATRLFSVDKILEGHTYLKGLDKSPFTGEYFRSQLTGALKNRGKS